MIIFANNSNNNNNSLIIYNIDITLWSNKNMFLRSLYCCGSDSPRENTAIIYIAEKERGRVWKRHDVSYADIIKASTTAVNAV